MHLDGSDPARADPRAEQFRAIYRAEFEFVWAVARRFGVSPAALDDVVQEVFLAAYRSLPHLQFEVSPRSWLYAVTRRVAWHHRRDATRLARRVAAFAAASPKPVDAPHERHEAAQWLERLLARLPRGSREVWEMTEVLGMRGQEIAAELELPVNTVYSRLRLARAQLLALSAEPEAVAAGVAALRREAAPPAKAELRGWAGLLPMLGSGGGLPAIASAWATSRAAVAGTLLAAGTAVVVAVAPAPRGPADGPNHHMTEGRGDDAPASRAGPDVDRLAAEIAWTDRARARLAAGDADGALALLAAHAREFPAGALLDAREAARVEAHCLRGRRGRAPAGRARPQSTPPRKPPQTRRCLRSLRNSAVWRRSRLTGSYRDIPLLPKTGQRLGDGARPRSRERSQRRATPHHRRGTGTRTTSPKTRRRRSPEQRSNPRPCAVLWEVKWPVRNRRRGPSRARAGR
jgi:RNA polymerase sigma factor (sigma-70 family)